MDMERMEQVSALTQQHDTSNISDIYREIYTYIYKIHQLISAIPECSDFRENH